VSAVRGTALVKSFGPTRAVDGVDIELGPGEVRGLLGPNGAGKTTLLRLMFGLVRPEAGAIELFGRPLETAGSPELQDVAGFVEDPTFYPYLSGRVNVELLVKLDRHRELPAIAGALERVGLAAHARDRVGTYSTGMRQRLGIAAALLRSPKLLLLDEPTSGLDPAGARDVGTLLRELAADGVAVLLSSHLIGELEKLCDSYTIMRHGRVVWDGTADRIRTEAPASAYLLATSDDQHAQDIACAQPGISVRSARTGGLMLMADDDHRLDGYTAALGQAGIGTRRLDLLVSPLEAMFFALTGEAPVDQLGPHDLADQVLAQA
jgi:ABC-2 type transport system ATP-binding protein